MNFYLGDDGLVCCPRHTLVAALGSENNMMKWLWDSWTIISSTPPPPGILPRNYTPPVVRCWRQVDVPSRDGTKTMPFLKFPRGDLEWIDEFPGGAQLIVTDAWKAQLAQPLRYTPPNVAPQLLNYQQAAVSWIETEYFNEISTQLTLEMQVGQGKTVTGCAIGLRTGRPILAIVPLQAIRSQWIDDFNKHLARCVGSNATAIEYVNSMWDSPTERVNRNEVLFVAITNSMRDKPPSFYRQFGCVLLDESHTFHSPANIEILWNAMACPRVIGLTGSPLLAPSGLDEAVLRFLPCIQASSIPGYDTGETGSYSGVVMEYRYQCPAEHTVPSGNPYHLALSNLVADPWRNRMLANIVEMLLTLHLNPAMHSMLGLGPRPAEAATPDHPEGGIRSHVVLVLTERVEHTVVLRKTFIDHFRNKGIDMVIDAPELTDESGKQCGNIILKGGYSSEEIRPLIQAANTNRLIIGTYGYCKMGISIRDVTALVLATPRKNGHVQIYGRNRRKGSDKSIVRIIVDVIDDGQPMMAGQVSSRRKAANALGYTFHKAKIHWEDPWLSARMAN